MSATDHLQLQLFNTVPYTKLPEPKQTPQQFSRRDAFYNTIAKQYNFRSEGKA
jgi:hypothetical protein